MKLTLFPEDAYRLWLFPIVGEEANAIIDNEGFNEDTFDEIECIYSEETERSYDIFIDFYTSDDGAEYSIEDGDQEELDDNALCIDWSKYDIEINETEPDEDFLLIERLQKVAVNYDAVDVFEDIRIRHNETTDDHLEIIVAAIRRRMKQVAKQLVADGLAEDEESVRFALRYGQINGCKYVFDINAEEFDPDKLRTINCEDWNDCDDISESLQEYWPDRLARHVVYDGKFYTGSCENVDDFYYNNVDLVDCNLESVL